MVQLSVTVSSWIRPFPSRLAHALPFSFAYPWAVAVRVSIRVRLTGAPAIKASYLDRHIIPAHLHVEYVYDAGAGWWKARNVKLSGPRILKPKVAGVIRLGRDWHDRSWSAWGKRDIQEAGDLPEWLDNLVSKLRPSGELALPGM